MVKPFTPLSCPTARKAVPFSLPRPPRGIRMEPSVGGCPPWVSSWLGTVVYVPTRDTAIGMVREPEKDQRPVGTNTMPPLDTESSAAWNAAVLSVTPSGTAPKSRTDTTLVRLGLPGAAASTSHGCSALWWGD